jgi:hypothetical protein
MPPDMFYNCNEEIKRNKEQTVSSRNLLVGRDRIRRLEAEAGLGQTLATYLAI